MSIENFERALKFVFPSEGGYVNNRYDRGGATNMGITQKTYDLYRQRQGLPREDVRSITKDEASKLYYEEYWLPSGADDITDPNAAVAVFDTAVLHGPATTKNFYSRSNGDLNEFLNIRQQSYDRIVESNPTQKIFYTGWNNRVNNLRKSIEAGVFTDDAGVNKGDPYLKSLVDTIMSRYIGEDNNFSREDIKNMTNEEFMRNEKRIIEQMINGTLKDAQPDYEKYTNPVSGRRKVYTKEEVNKMSSEEFIARETEIMAQANSIGLPSRHEVYKQSARSTGSNGGKWVTINGNHVLIDK